MALLKILHLEDNHLDAALVQGTLESENIDCRIHRVSTREAFESALQTGGFDLILSDFSLPAFDGLSALRLVHATRPDVPFIFLSGTIGEERAIESLRNGAVDYILKDRIQRLGPAIIRARNDALARADQMRRNEIVRRQSELLNEARDAIFVRNLDQVVTYWNKGAERVYGWTAGEILGRKASDLLYKNTAPQRDAIWQAVLRDGEWNGELAQVTKSGNEICVASRRTLLRNGSGAPVAILNINTDITEKKEIERQLLRSQRMESIGALAGGIAHDLNNVLAPILMASELLRERMRDRDDLRMLDIAKNSAQRGAELVKQILQFARGTKGEDLTVNIKSLIDELEKFIGKTFSPSIIITISAPDDLPLVAGDPTQVHQILLNLCVNARDAMPGGGRLTIEASSVKDPHVMGKSGPLSGHYVELAVSDTGTGIPPEALSRIFEPFFTTKPEGQGTGLGLATVTTILRNHHGFLDVETAMGKGTTFRAFLPVASEPSTKKTVAGETNQSGAGEWILLADDEQALLGMTKELLEAHNYRVVTASNGIEALARFEENPGKFAVVITDLLMPGLSGDRLVATIGDRSPLTATICLSGSADENYFRSDQTAATAFLRKPCSTKDLLGTIQKLLQKN